MTHFATAEALAGDDAAFFGEQLLRFRAAAAPLRARFPAISRSFTARALWQTDLMRTACIFCNGFR
mgnify:CR=1 FL=1